MTPLVLHDDMQEVLYVKYIAPQWNASTTKEKVS